MANCQTGAIILSRDDAARIFDALLNAKRDNGLRMMALDRMRRRALRDDVELTARANHGEALTIALQAIGEAHNLGGW